MRNFLVFSTLSDDRSQMVECVVFCQLMLKVVQSPTPSPYGTKVDSGQSAGPMHGRQ